MTKTLPALYAHPAAFNGLMLTREPDGSQHVITFFNADDVGETVQASDGWQLVTYRVVREPFDNYGAGQ